MPASSSFSLRFNLDFSDLSVSCSSHVSFLAASIKRFRFEGSLMNILSRKYDPGISILLICFAVFFYFSWNEFWDLHFHCNTILDQCSWYGPTCVLSCQYSQFFKEFHTGSVQSSPVNQISFLHVIFHYALWLITLVEASHCSAILKECSEKISQNGNQVSCSAKILVTSPWNR